MDIFKTFYDLNFGYMVFKDAQIPWKKAVSNLSINLALSVH